MEKAEKIKREITRLNKIYKDLEQKKKDTVQGLIQRMAYMRITLDDFEIDLDKGGFVEWFSQGTQEPYARKRPVADLYNTMNTSYQKIVKQLSDLIPIEKIVDKDDGFGAFVGKRDD